MEAIYKLEILGEKNLWMETQLRMKTSVGVSVWIGRSTSFWTPDVIIGPIFFTEEYLSSSRNQKARI